MKQAKAAKTRSLRQFVANTWRAREPGTNALETIGAKRVPTHLDPLHASHARTRKAYPEKKWDITHHDFLLGCKLPFFQGVAPKPHFLGCNLLGFLRVASGSRYLSKVLGVEAEYRSRGQPPASKINPDSLGGCLYCGWTENHEIINCL